MPKTYCTAQSLQLDPKMTRTILLFIALTSCSIRELPPPTVPAQVLTSKPVELGDPPAGQGTVVLDTAEPAVVQEVTGTERAVASAGGVTAVGFGVATSLVCTTPCTAHLAQGQHQLVFAHAADGEWGGTARLDVGVHPVASAPTAAVRRQILDDLAQ